MTTDPRLKSGSSRQIEPVFDLSFDRRFPPVAATGSTCCSMVSAVHATCSPQTRIYIWRSMQAVPPFLPWPSAPLPPLRSSPRPRPFVWRVTRPFPVVPRWSAAIPPAGSLAFLRIFEGTPLVARAAHWSFSARPAGFGVRWPAIGIEAAGLPSLYWPRSC